VVQKESKHILLNRATNYSLYLTLTIKMKAILQSLVLVPVMTLVLFSCDDDKGLSKTDLLTTNLWKVTTMTVEGRSVFDNFDECLKDNTKRGKQ
jgi:hypothetical protein